MIRALIFLCVLLGFSAQADAGTVTGKILLLRTYSDGPATYNPSNQAVLNVYVTGMAGACGGSVARAAIHSNNPLYYAVFSVVMTAFSEKRDVEVQYADTCSISAYSWDLNRVDILPPP